MTIVVTVALLVCAVIAAKFWLPGQPDVISEEFTTAEVLSLEKKKLSYSDRTGGTITNNIGIARLRLEDGKTFTSTVSQPYPKPGDKIQARLIRYSDGTASATAMASEY